MNEINLEQNEDKLKFKNSMFDWVEALLVAVFLVVFIFIFVFRLVGVDGQSMYPTLHDNDKLVISNLGYTPKTGDIVVLTKKEFLPQPIVKRIIAIEGQTVDINYETGIVYVDNEPLDEPYVNEKTYLEGTTIFPLTVPKDHVFVMGDNRNHSSDSRVATLGAVKEDLILGKVIFRLLPLGDFGKVD